MSRTIRLTVLVVLEVLCVRLSPVLSQPLFNGAQDPLAGSRVFGSSGCVKCHSVNGIGGKVGPDLGRIPRARSFYDLAAAMWNHLPAMAKRMRQLGIPRPHLDTRQTGGLIAFLYTLNYFDPPGNAEAGRRLFTTKRCIMCHQLRGRGGVVGPSLDFLRQYGSPIFVAAALWNHGPAMAAAMRERGIERPSFTGTELLDLIEYVKASSTAPADSPLYVLPGRADQGRRLFAEKRCIECHSVSGEGGRVAPDLAERGRQLSLTQFAAAMWNKASAMTAVMNAQGISVPQLQAEEMADLVAYLYAVRYFARRGDPSNGPKLAVSRGCLDCHALYGERGKIASDLSAVMGLESPARVISALWNHSFIDDERSARRRAEWPPLHANEMADLIAYLQGLHLAK